jgi:hypothetical protein
VLIGADPPIAWLEKLGVRFVERPHQHQMGKTDDIVRRVLRGKPLIECPEDAARAAAQVLGGSVGLAPTPVAPMPVPATPGDNNVSGPRKWLRSATSIFSNRAATSQSGIQPQVKAPSPPPPPIALPSEPKAKPNNKRFDQPVPLSEFAQRNKQQPPPPPQPQAPIVTVGGANGGTGLHHLHSGHGRRDQLSAGERTRILRMLRDEGGRLADEESAVYIGAAPSREYDFDLDDSPVPAPLPPRPDVPAKPAVVVGIEQARRGKKSANNSEARKQPVPPAPAPSPAANQLAPLHLDDPPIAPPAAPAPVAPVLPVAPPSAPPPRLAAPTAASRRPVPAPFNEEPTRQVDEDLLKALRAAPAASPTSPPPFQKLSGNPSSKPPSVSFNEEPTRMAPSNLASAFQDDDLTRDRSDLLRTPPGGRPTLPEVGTNTIEERTRAVNIRGESMSDIDWDID